MRKAKIKIEKIFRSVVNTSRGPQNKFVLMYKSFGFSGWGRGSEYKEGDVVEIEYDENSKYETEKYTYFNLIRKETPKATQEGVLKEILEALKRIEAKLEAKDLPPKEILPGEPSKEPSKELLEESLESSDELP